MQIFAENAKEYWLQHICKKKEMAKHVKNDKVWSKVESKYGPSMLRNIIGPSFDARNDNVCLFLFKVSSPCRTIIL